jgi:Tc5 transposase DNA-binding domain
MCRAIDEYKEQELQPKNLRLSYQTVADTHNVSKSTLQRLVTGGVSMSTFNAGKQRLTPAEERVVADFCVESADRGFPLTHDNVYKSADNILSARLGSEHDSLGLNWVDTFLIRHHEELQTHWSKPLDTQRGQALNPTNVRLWFDLVKENIVDKNIHPENVCGMDGSGFPPSDQGTQRVIWLRGTKTQHKQGSAEQENVTAIVTICADRTVLQPTIMLGRLRSSQVLRILRVQKGHETL